MDVNFTNHTMARWSYNNSCGCFQLAQRAYTRTQSSAKIISEYIKQFISDNCQCFQTKGISRMAVQPAKEDQQDISTGPHVELGTYLVKQLGELAGTAYKLVNSLSSVQSGILENERVSREIEEEAAKFSKDSDPEVASKIIELKDKYRSCINDGKIFLDACVDMASYATEEQHLAEIDENLRKEGRFDKLKTFVEDLCGYLKECQKCTKEFRTTKEELEQEVKVRQNEYVEKANESGAAARMARERHSDAFLEQDKAKVYQVASQFAMDAAYTAAETGMLSHSMSLLTMTVTGFGVFVAARFNEHDAARDGLQQKRALESHKKKEAIYEDAKHCIFDLQVSMSDTVAIIDDMCRHAQHAKKLIEGSGSKGLKHYTDSDSKKNPGMVDGYYDIKNKIERLRKAMDSIKEKLGQGGEKISSEPYELVISNTQPQQPTDTSETELKYVPAIDLGTTLQPRVSGSSGPPPPQPVGSNSSPVTTSAVAEEDQQSGSTSHFVSGFSEHSK